MDKFEIFYFGIKEGINTENAVDQLSKLLNIEIAAANKIISHTSVAISSGLNKAKADQYFKAFDKVGLNVEIRPCSIHQQRIKEKARAEEKAEQDANNIEPALNVMDMEEKQVGVEFNGKGFEYFKIWIVNIFLTIITLGIYSAWAKVRNKQYFYGNTLIEGSSFQYTAKPIAILKGRIIAFVALAIYSGVNQYNPIIGGVLFIILMGFLPWIIIRSLSFNARNSVFRNVRFDFNANVFEAVKAFILWPILVPFSLGFALPFVWYKQGQFFISNSAFGTKNFEFSASAKDYYLIFFKLILVLIASMFMFAVIFGGAAYLIGGAEILNDPTATSQLFLGPLIGIFTLLFYLFIFAYMATSLGNLYFNATTLGQHGFQMNLQTKNMTWLYFSNTIGIILSLGLFVPWAKVRTTRYRTQCLRLDLLGGLDHFVNAELQNVSALGEQVGEVFDMDVSAF